MIVLTQHLFDTVSTRAEHHKRHKALLDLFKGLLQGYYIRLH